MENNRFKATALTVAALAVSTLPVLIAALSYFPFWISKGGAYAVSGFALILTILAMSPLVKLIKEALKSPSSYMLWLGSFLLFLFLSRIADEMTVISLVGFISNLIGACLFKAAEGFKTEKKE